MATHSHTGTARCSLLAALGSRASSSAAGVASITSALTYPSCGWVRLVMTRDGTTLSPLLSSPSAPRTILTEINDTMHGRPRRVVSCHPSVGSESQLSMSIPTTPERPDANPMAPSHHKATRSLFTSSEKAQIQSSRLTTYYGLKCRVQITGRRRVLSRDKLLRRRSEFGVTRGLKEESSARAFVSTVVVGPREEQSTREHLASPLCLQRIRTRGISLLLLRCAISILRS